VRPTDDDAPAGRLLRGRLSFQLGLQPKANAVQPDRHVVSLELEHPGEFLDRQPFHVTQQEQARIVTVERRDGAAKLLFEQDGTVDDRMGCPVVEGRLAARRKYAAGRFEASTSRPDRIRRKTVCRTSSASAGRPVTRSAARNTIS
jgi:hypothetical protein